MTMLTATLGLVDASVLAVVGYGVVFVGLIALMAVVVIMGKFFTKKDEKPETTPVAAPAPVVAPTPVAAPAPVATDVAPGTAGQLKTYDVPPKTCAMLMAIVANKMGKPLNELRFISIKEVKE